MGGLDQINNRRIQQITTARKQKKIIGIINSAMLIDCL